MARIGRGHLGQSHTLPTYEERREAAKNNHPRQMAKWLKTDHIIDLVYCDILNGKSNSDIIKKLMNGLYDGQEKGVVQRTAYDYMEAARQRIAFDFERNAEKLREDLYGKMLAVYEDAVSHNDRYNALIALDKIMKLTGIGMEKPQNAIQVNAASSGVTINFGFSSDKEEEETDDD